MKLFLSILLFFFIFRSTNAQQYYLISANITIKEKISENQFAIIKGIASYNKYNDKTTLDFTFPEKITWILTKDSLIQYSNGKFLSKISAQYLNEYSIFKLLLNGTLKNYGLQKSQYSITEVSNSDDGSVISTWKPPKAAKYQFGKVVISQKGGKLNGVVFFDTKEKIVSKQIFSDYVLIKGFYFPGKIIQINYSEQGEKYKITTFDHLEIK
jgi:hypothetical protein